MAGGKNNPIVSSGSRHKLSNGDTTEDIEEEEDDEELLVCEQVNGEPNGHHLMAPRLNGRHDTVSRHRASPSEPLSTLCHTMKKQIISR